MEGADGGGLDMTGQRRCGKRQGRLLGSATGSNVAQVSKSDGPPDLAVMGLGPVGVNTESRHGGATLVTGAGLLLVATALEPGDDSAQEANGLRLELYNAALEGHDQSVCPVSDAELVKRALQPLFTVDWLIDSSRAISSFVIPCPIRRSI